MSISRTRVIAALVVASALAALGAYLLLVGPKRSQADELNNRISVKQAELVRARSGVSSPQPTVSVADVFRLTKAMPDGSDMPGLLVLLSRLVRESGMTFESITPLTPVGSTGYQVLPFTVVVEGRYGSLAGLLSRLRALVRVRSGRLHAGGRLFAVERVTLAEGEKLFPYVRATLALNAFVNSGGTSGASSSSSPPSTPAGPPVGTQAAGATR
jgi:Pilus assembly protein, PilO